MSSNNSTTSRRGGSSANSAPRPPETTPTGKPSTVAECRAVIRELCEKHGTTFEESRLSLRGNRKQVHVLSRGVISGPYCFSHEPAQAPPAPSKSKAAAGQADGGQAKPKASNQPKKNNLILIPSNWRVAFVAKCVWIGDVKYTEIGGYLLDPRFRFRTIDASQLSTYSADLDGPDSLAGTWETSPGAAFASAVRAGIKPGEEEPVDVRCNGKLLMGVHYEETQEMLRRAYAALGPKAVVGLDSKTLAIFNTWLNNSSKDSDELLSRSPGAPNALSVVPPPLAMPTIGIDYDIATSALNMLRSGGRGPPPEEESKKKDKAVVAGTTTSVNKRPHNAASGGYLPVRTMTEEILGAGREMSFDSFFQFADHAAFSSMDGLATAQTDAQPTKSGLGGLSGREHSLDFRGGGLANMMMLRDANGNGSASFQPEFRSHQLRRNANSVPGSSGAASAEGGSYVQPQGASHYPVYRAASSETAYSTSTPSHPAAAPAAPVPASVTTPPGGASSSGFLPAPREASFEYFHNIGSRAFNESFVLRDMSFEFNPRDASLDLSYAASSPFVRRDFSIEAPFPKRPKIELGATGAEVDVSMGNPGLATTTKASS